MLICRVRRFATFLLILAAPSLVQAQELAGSFDQLRVLIKPGDTVNVTDAAGREVTGRIADLSPTSLSLLVAGETRDFPEGDITAISQRRPDPLSNGAKWGFGVGAGLGLLAGLAIASELDAAGAIPMAALLYGGIGAGIGVGMDAMISSTQVIYAKRVSSAKFRLSPFRTGGRTGVLMAVGF